ncbi:Ankyrin repeat domain-containing protein 39 [Vermiconidia calcicola]|uniref:Ankyrin repeat domain-containing protein 39 n=1 Tax=Vermiconidia calcicola TaxID=1690605 RepID=A0ACC3MBA1_9PEZI|nr:Ankyrin repeat domain-containing protein 39 [Vermiconidia calcicola]
MPDPTGIVQTIDASIGIATCLVRICRFALDYKNAGELAERTATQVKEVRHHLDNARQFIVERSEHVRAPSRPSDRRYESALLMSIQRCKTRLEELGTAIHGEDIRDPDSLLQEHVARLRIAFNQGRIGIITVQLGSDMTAMQLALLLLSSVDQMRHCSTANRDQEEVLSILRELSVGLSKVRQSQASSADSSNASSAGPSAETDRDSGGLIAHHSNSLQNLEECARDVDEMVERGTSIIEISRADLQGSSGTGTETAIDDADDETQQTAERLLAEGASRLANAHLSLTRSSYPLEIMNDMIQQHRSLARAEGEAGHWEQAWKHTTKVISCSEECQQSYQQPFDDRLEVYGILVDTLLELKWWNEAFDAVEELRSRLEFPSGSPEDEDHPAIAMINHLEALVFFKRSQKSRITPIHDSEAAHGFAKASFNMTGRLLTSQPTDLDLLPRYQTSGQLLVSICLKRGDKVEADNVQHQLDRAGSGSTSVNGDTAPPVNRNIEEIQANGSTLLISAVKESDEQKVRDLLDGHPGANVDIHDHHGYTALHRAAKDGSMSIVELLLEYGADMNKQMEGDNPATPLLLAVKGRHKALVRTLLDREADVSPRFRDGWSLLHWAIRHSATAITETLLANPNSSALINVEDESQMTPLHHCVRDGRPEQAQLLLSHSANSNIENCNGQTPLHLALEKPGSGETKRLVDLLLDDNAQVDEDGLSKDQKDAYNIHLNRRRRDSVNIEAGR